MALLLFGSGFCALIYQTVWLRQFRLIFGASTLASAAVIAIFMGGLGIGGHLLGRRIDRSANPLAFYGVLEVGVALSAAATPLLLWIVRSGYLAIGGSFAMGGFLATIVRLLLATIVLAIPTFLMGGTLPAAARSVEHSGDEGRRSLAVLYATNTLGAVAGAVLSTFFLLERFGNLRALIAAALLNILVALTALLISNSMRARGGEGADEINAAREEEQTPVPAAVPPRFVYGAAAVVGFAFFLMELVWYRMLAPLLGGTTYTFGLILAVGLAGIGAGSYAYVALRRGRATIFAFAISCALEALFIVIPLALGDRVAFLALLLRPIGALGFSGYVLGWTLVTILVVFPPAFIAGLQFPLLISLLGEGRREVARHVGTAYAWNTAGAIVGSIAGGFGLLPLLTAPGSWRAVVVVLVLLVGAAIFAGWSERRLSQAWIAGITSVVSIALLFSPGPTAFWRHSPIGAGRADIPRPSRNQLIDLQHTRQRTTVWEKEGLESSVSVANSDGYAFIVNGKSDGHARLDGGTQVMGAILPSLLHPNPRRVAVIGLGTGSTAGWFAAVPSIQQVDVVEIEPAILDVARMCSLVNRDVMRNPKARIMVGDGREFLLARGDRYDIISSEPSNPYRAGIANLFTVEFYRAAASRLNRGGILAQFLQGYEVDSATIRTIYATITTVFPHVETWQTQAGDLLLVASVDPLIHEPAGIERRLNDNVIRTALRNVWWVEDLAGVYARYVCGTSTAQRLATGARRNTDDRPIVEYAFARTLGVVGAFNLNELRAFARSRADDMPASIRMSPSAVKIEMHRASAGIPHEAMAEVYPEMENELRLRTIAQLRYMQEAYADTWTIWQAQKVPAESPLEILTYAEVLAERGDPTAGMWIEKLRGRFPIEADVLTARWLWRQRKGKEAAGVLARAFERYRLNPWPLSLVMRRALALTNQMSQEPQFPEWGQPLLAALEKPFAIEMLNEHRKSTILFIAERLKPGHCSPTMLEVVKSYEPAVPWQQIFLERRAACYEAANHPARARAKADLAEFRRFERQSLDESLK